MPIINSYDPLSSGADAAASYVQTSKDNRAQALALAYAKQRNTASDARNAATDKRDDDRNAELKREYDATRADRQAEIVTQTEEQQRKDALAARREADKALHEARADAIAKAKQDLLERKDKEAYQTAMLRIESSYKVGMARVKEAKEAAQIRAAATVQAANIHGAATVQSAGIRAGATLQAAGMREQGADRRAGDRNDLIKRGQDLGAGYHRAQLGQKKVGALQNAMLRLGVGPTAISPPVNDPQFQSTLHDFAHLTPKGRDALLAAPNLSPQTRAYLQRLGPVLGNALEDDAAFDPAAITAEDEDGD